MQIIPRQIIPFHLSHSCNARETRVAKRALKTFSKRTLRNCRAESRQKPRSSSQIGNHDCLITIMFAKAESRSVICGDGQFKYAQSRHRTVRTISISSGFGDDERAKLISLFSFDDNGNTSVNLSHTYYTNEHIFAA